MKKKKKTIINPNNKDNTFFQYKAMIALDHREIKSNPERISNVKPFINKYNWDGLKYALICSNDCIRS